MKKKILRSLILVVAYSQISYSQDSAENKQLLVWFDTTVKQQNLNINKGFKYTEKYRTFNNSNHFLNDTFTSGDIIYDNQTYYNVSCNYDILDDNLIVRIKSSTENYSLILDKSKVTGFRINNKEFIKINTVFYELRNNLGGKKLLKKQQVKKKELVRNKRTYYNFEKFEDYFIADKKAVLPLTKKKNWYASFPNQEKMIDFYFKNKKSPNSFSESLFSNLSKQ